MATWQHRRETALPWSISSAKGSRLRELNGCYQGDTIRAERRQSGVEGQRRDHWGRNLLSLSHGKSLAAGQGM